MGNAKEPGIMKNSINAEQEEENTADLTGSEAVERIRTLVDDAKTCFFRTSVSTGASDAVRPMNVLEVDEKGSIWFLSASDSHKNEEVEADPGVELFFQGSKHSGFLHLSGVAKVTKDQTVIERLWTPFLKTWFTEGKDDPRITAIEFVPEEGYYWDNKHGDTIAGIKILIGAAVGKTLDDSIEGMLDP